MRYTNSITDFFQSPKWLNNLLLGGVCMLIPIVGPIALQGWLITGLWMNPDAEAERDGRKFSRFPEFKFDQFGEYLQRGMWPFLVMFVVMMVFMVVIWIAMFAIITSIAVSAQGQPQQHELTAAQSMMIGIGFLCYFAFIMLINLIMIPLSIRATIVQDFAPAFSLAFMRQFIGLMWVEILGSVLFLMVAGIPLAICGALCFCVGMYAAIALMIFATQHLHHQMYQLYLARGGVPVPISDKLIATMPPALPSA